VGGVLATTLALGGTALAGGLHTLAQEAGEEVPDDLTKAQASERIDALQERTGRG